MSDLSDYTQANVADALLHHVNMPAAPATVYLQPHVGAPGTDGSTNQADLARVAVTAATGFTAYDPDTGTSNTGEILFDAAAADVGLVDHMSVWDDATAGNCLLAQQDAMSSPKTINEGDALRIPAGSLVFSF